MTHALIARTWDESAHTRAPSGQSGGGEFAGQGQKNAEKSANRRRSTGQRGHAGVPKGQYGYDGSNGSGYGVKGGDANVKQLQGELNRLGFTDGAGKKLAEDGKFGPKTTGAVKTAQKRLGMKPTGIITQGFIDRLKATKTLPKAVQARGGRPVEAVRRRDVRGPGVPAGRQEAVPAGLRGALPRRVVATSTRRTTRPSTPPTSSRRSRRVSRRPASGTASRSPTR
jgi:peptidoglycan hydrolase-like protein with peptidoglycan-binding domain